MVKTTNVFFFQAEDGIRDGHVTGVQTCALPICGRIRLAPAPDATAQLVQLGKPEPFGVQDHHQIGRASCRERVSTSDCDESVKKKDLKIEERTENQKKKEAVKQ